MAEQIGIKNKDLSDDFRHGKVRTFTKAEIKAINDKIIANAKEL